MSLPCATPESNADSFHTGQSVNSRLTSTSIGSAPDSEALQLFMAELGIEPWEEDEFAWIAEVGLLTPLPPRWVRTDDAETGSSYFVDTDTQISTWDNPLSSHLQRVVEVGRMHLRSGGGDQLFEEQHRVLWAEHKAELDSWHGPIQDDEGNSYFVNSRDGISSWQDPRINAQYIFDVQSSLLRHLQGILAAEDGDDDGCFGGGTPWETEDGAQVLMLEGTPVSRINPGQKVSRINRAMQQGVSTTDHTLTLQTMSNAADRVNSAWQTEEEVQRLRLLRKADERRMRKLSRKLTRVLADTIEGDEDAQRRQLEQKVLERARERRAAYAARGQGKL